MDNRTSEATRDEIHAIDKNVATLALEVEALKAAVKEMITRTEFMPVKMIVYGLATALMSSVFMAILAKVIIK